MFSLATAQPVSGALVTLLDPAGAPLLQVRTGSDGTVSIPNQAALGKMKWLLLSKDDDQLLLHFEALRGESEFQTFRINDFGAERDLYWGGYPGWEQGAAFLFTDRPVYRPGETIHFKGLVRNPDPLRPLPSPGGKGLLKAVDATGRTVVQRTVVLSETGSFDGDLALPKSRMGDFSLLFQMGEPAAANVGAACSVTVQEYVPNAFELKIAPPAAARLDSPEEFAVSAKYLRGGSLQKARVAWSLRAVDTRFEPEGFAGFGFGNALYDYRLEGRLLGKPMHAVSGTTALGAPGDVRIPVNLPANPTLPQPRSVRLFAEVTDMNQQTVSERVQFTAHARDFYLGVADFPSVLSEGERLPLQLVAVAANGLPVEEAVEVVANLSRLEWQTNRVQDADAAENFRSELLTEPLGERRLRTSPVVWTPNKWQLAEPDKKDPSFTLEKPGLYLLKLSAKDRSGREVVTLASVHVQAKGKTPLAWDYRNNFQAELVPDKSRYEPGETATLLVKTPISGPALVSVEGAGVQRHFLTRLEGNAPAIRVPLEENDAPNVHVCVTVLRGALDSPRKLPAPEYRIGYAMLHVARTGAGLDVALKPSRAEYRPGEQAEVFCEVRDAAGRPVSGAEVTLWAADEGVLSFTGFETPDPAGVFQRTRPLRVRTGLTISKLLRESDDQLPESLFENKGYLVGGFGKGGEDGVRRRFLGTAFWAPALRTDANGRANVAFTVPDGLTRYRIMGVVHHGGHRFGKAQASFEINKPIMLDAAAPLFAHVGDRLVLRGVVQNTTAAAGRATVRVELDGKASASQTSFSVEVPAQKSASVDLPVEVLQAGVAGWTLSAEFTSADGRVFRDAVLLTCKIDSPVPALREVVHKRFVAAETNLLDLVDPLLLRGTGSVRVSLAHSRIHELRGSVEHLLHYPYGCVEQTVSSLIPWLALRDFREAFPDLRLGDEEFQVAVERGIARVFSMQTPSGGLAYWPGGHTPNLWGSAYAAVGLAFAGKSGVPVDEEKFGRLLNFLSKALRGAADSSEKEALSPRALACYALALAGKPEAAYHEILFQKRALLSVESRAFLALAALETPNGEGVARALLALPSEQLEEDFWFGSVSRAKGVLLLAWARLEPGSANAERLANELLEERSSGHWRTTQGNAWALLGLTNSIRHAETGFVDSAGTLLTGAGSVPFRLATKHAVFEREVPLESSAKLVLRNPGGRPLYCQLAVETRPEAQPEPRQDRGYSLSRSYHRLNDDDSLSPLGEARVGERVLVTLELRARDRASYVALEDPLPAVFEAVNPRFKSQGSAQTERVRTFSADFTEVRADRVLFFADSMGPGRHLFRYVARVRAVGSATAPAPKVEEMYRPDRFGLGSPTVVQSVDAP